MSTYDLQSLNLPKLTGSGLKLFAAALDQPALRALLLGQLMENGGIPKFRQRRLDEPPTFLPLSNGLHSGNEQEASITSEGPAQKKAAFASISDYHESYRQHATTPLDVAQEILHALDTDAGETTPLHAFIAVDRQDFLRQAQASTERWQSGRPLSRLDGVPLAIKDEIDMLPYPTTVGTKFLGKQPAARDATAVERLRLSGAALIGKANMHEIGINPNGSNSHYGHVSNPYAPGRDPGGSSSGPAAATAAGFCPASLGADGGGSIRIPAALCGMVGLKPTFGRVSEAGAAPLCWSVAHMGPIAASVADAVLILTQIAGPDPRDVNSLRQPPLVLDGWNCANLQGLRIGYYPQWFEHANPEVVKACRAQLDVFKAAGAHLVEIDVPELDNMRVAHAIIILSEMAAAMAPYQDHWQDFAPSVRLSLILGRELSAGDYLQAQRMRTRALNIFRDVFGRVDLIASPSTALTAQPIPLGGAPAGWSDLATDTEMMRFVYPANLTGLPALTFPAGYDAEGLPVGMQLIGRHWEERLLFQAAYTAEIAGERRLPVRHYPILSKVGSL